MESKSKINDELALLLQEKMEKYTRDKQISCAAGLEIARLLDIPPALVGGYADAMKIKLTHCSLGLFGYQPEKRRVKPDADVSAELKQALENALRDGRLSCAAVWEIADRLGIPLTKAANACEGMGIKIIQCQLGAF